MIQIKQCNNIIPKIAYLKQIAIKHHIHLQCESNLNICPLNLYSYLNPWSYKNLVISKQETAPHAHLQEVHSANKAKHQNTTSP